MDKKLPVTEFTFKLTDPIKYAQAGDEVFSYELKLLAPTSRHRASLIRLKQGYFRSILSMQKNTQDRPAVVAENATTEPVVDMEIDGPTIMSLFYMSDIDLVALENEFKALLLSAGICEVAPGVKLQDKLLDAIKFEDFEKLMGEYLAVFIVSSST
jgi:hypothetical protein